MYLKIRIYGGNIFGSLWNSYSNSLLLWHSWNTFFQLILVISQIRGLILVYTEISATNKETCSYVHYTYHFSFKTVLKRSRRMPGTESGSFHLHCGNWGMLVQFWSPEGKISTFTPSPTSFSITLSRKTVQCYNVLLYHIRHQFQDLSRSGPSVLFPGRVGSAAPWGTFQTFLATSPIGWHRCCKPSDWPTQSNATSQLVSY